MRLVTPEGHEQAPPSRRTFAASLFTAGYALALSPPAAAAITTPSEGLIIEEPHLNGHGGYRLPAYVARPRLSGRRYPAVIVVNEIFGIHAYIKDVCRRLAHLGFCAIAPDYFDRAGDPSQLQDFAEIRRVVGTAGHEQVMADTQGALDWLAPRRSVLRGRIGITGFCWGGGVVWMAAARFPQIKAGIAWYGRLAAPPEDGFGYEPGRPWPIDIAGSLKAPVLGLYAAEDQGIPLESVEAMRQALARAGNPTHSEIVVYPGVHHGFHADYRDSYNQAAAEDGWARMLAWLRANGVGRS
jgi:carboxymethylenebutenolidase